MPSSAYQKSPQLANTESYKAPEVTGSIYFGSDSGTTLANFGSSCDSGILQPKCRFRFQDDS